jgi:Niemann-Pick C1 protein
MTQILPFIMFGIGLDNTYIITGAYGRTSQASDPVARIDETIQTVGLSITLTTMTSVLAFGLGCISSIPAVYWLCLYAFPTLFINYLYQVTFFVALIVIDEHRMQAKRRGCCVCIRATGEPASSGEGTQDNSNKPSELPLADRIMLWYADKLLLPAVKAAVLVIFAALLVGMAYSASLLKQEFKFTDVLPSDSYITEFFDAFDVWYSRGAVYPYVYFRYVDQSDAEIQKQMVNYVNDLVGIDAIEEQPPNFWLRDFRAYVSSTNGSMADMSFNEQLDAFLHEPGYELLYRDEIIRDNNGDIIVSRVSIHMPNVDTDDVKNQVDALEDQRDVTKAQPINKDKKDWPFFTFADLYNIWQFYAVAVDELIFTTIVGVVAVTGVATIFIPHWTAGVFTMPLISILYVDLLGFLQLAGAHVNAVSYIALVMSIGLLVDFVVHILLRFYETTGTREEKVRETLRTMGSSILTGAVSTFLGIIPLGFSTSEIFSTVFNAFIGLVVLGSTHGLILLPVVLSLIGPVECIKAEKEAADDPAETSDSLQTESVKAEKEAAEDPADTTDSFQAEIDV